MMGAAITEFDFGSHGGEQAAGGFDVAHLRDVFQDDSIFGKQSCSHAGKGGILRAADAHCAQEWGAAADD